MNRFLYDEKNILKLRDDLKEVLHELFTKLHLKIDLTFCIRLAIMTHTLHNKHLIKIHSEFIKYREDKFNNIATTT